MDDSKNSNRNLLIGGGILVVLLIALFIYMFTQFLGTDDTAPEETTTPFPESGLRDDLGPTDGGDGYVGFASSTDNLGTGLPDPTPTTNIPSRPLAGQEADWKDEVVSYTGPGQVVVPSTGNTSGSPLVPTGDYSISTDFMFDIDQMSRTPSQVKLPNGVVVPYEDLTNLDKMMKAYQNNPSLVEEFATVKSCGQLTMPRSEKAVEQFFAQLHTFPEIACLGNAVADNCKSTWLDVMTQYRIPLRVYVAERNDGVCGYGNTNVKGSVELCSIAFAMNTINEDSKTFDQWMKEFESEPGETFAQLYTELTPDSGVGGFMDCVMYDI